MEKDRWITGVHFFKFTPEIAYQVSQLYFMYQLMQLLQLSQDGLQDCCVSSRSRILDYCIKEHSGKFNKIQNVHKKKKIITKVNFALSKFQFLPKCSASSPDQMQDFWNEPFYY